MLENYKEKEIGINLLSDLNIFNKYAKYIEPLNRRETWDEICTRYENMMVEKYPALSTDIIANMKLVRAKKVLPSMRALQFAGPAIERNPSRIYNCAYMPVDSIYAFSEAMFLLLGGTGVGYSVQKAHINELPEITRPTKKRRYLVGDSIEGWADAVKALMKAYLDHKSLPEFDFSDIRKKGARLVTAGGKAPGPEPLKKALFLINLILEKKENGSKLTSIECHDIMCHIADAVLAGGIRRAAMISLFSFDDIDMMTCKSGNWWELNPQRGRANNSVVLSRNRITKEDFEGIWKLMKDSNAGEPGIYFTNNTDWGTNPCCEIGLRPYQFCNLCEINVSNITSQQDLEERVVAATLLGTLQAGFTNFHYLRPIWEATTKKDALLGIGMTGIASGATDGLDLRKAATIAVEVNKHFSQIIGINPAARVTTVKPSGTTSCVLGTSSGIHAWHNDFFIRRSQLSGNDPLVSYFKSINSTALKPLGWSPGDYVFETPIKAPQGAITRHTETATTLLERVKRFSDDWVRPGHRRGDNTHNVSLTINVKEDEWDQVKEWLWDNRNNFNGAAILPHDGGSYTQAPFEDITEDQYNTLVEELLKEPIDFTQITENEDNTSFTQELACAGGNC